MIDGLGPPGETPAALYVSVRLGPYNRLCRINGTGGNAMDVITIGVFLGTLAALIIGYAAWGSMGRALERVQREADTRGMGPSRDGGRYVGGSDKPGSN